MHRGLATVNFMVVMGTASCVQGGGETFGYILSIIVLWTSEVPPWAVHQFAQTWHLSLKKGI